MLSVFRHMLYIVVGKRPVQALALGVAAAPTCTTPVLSTAAFQAKNTSWVQDLRCSDQPSTLPDLQQNRHKHCPCNHNNSNSRQLKGTVALSKGGKSTRDHTCI
jgi:hypothetical protein